jgi:hypothetical protein
VHRVATRRRLVRGIAACGIVMCSVATYGVILCGGVAHGTITSSPAMRRRTTRAHWRPAGDGRPVLWRERARRVHVRHRAALAQRRRHELAHERRPAAAAGADHLRQAPARQTAAGQQAVERGETGGKPRRRGPLVAQHLGELPAEGVQRERRVAVGHRHASLPSFAHRRLPRIGRPPLAPAVLDDAAGYAPLPEQKPKLAGWWRDG